jgi:hypothetical protein
MCEGSAMRNRWMRTRLKRHFIITLSSAFFFAGCAKKEFDDSAYVLVRNSTVSSSIPALRAYFVDEGAKLNGISCREMLELANEAVQARISRGETHLVKYECVSIREARERGFK